MAGFKVDKQRESEVSELKVASNAGSGSCSQHRRCFSLLCCLLEPSVSISGSRAIAVLKLPWLLKEMAKKDMQN